MIDKIRNKRKTIETIIKTKKIEQKTKNILQTESVGDSINPVNSATLIY